MYGLQKTVTVNDRIYHITNNGDFRMVLDCFDALNDEEISEDARVLASFLIFYNEFNSIDDVYELEESEVEQLLIEMFKFFDCGQEESPGAKTSRPLIDWHKDEQLICAAVNNVANTEIRAIDFLHWWTFMGYYLSIGESVLATIVSIRDKIVKGKKLEKWEQEFKRDNPEYFIWKSTTIEDREMENLVKNIWNKE